MPSEAAPAAAEHRPPQAANTQATRPRSSLSTRQPCPELRVVEMQHRRLLTAFVELLNSRKLQEVRIGEICKRAGVSRRTFYDIFDSQEACFLAALDWSLEWLSVEMRDTHTPNAAWQERIRASVTSLLELLDANPSVARMWVIQTLRGGTKVLARRAAVIETLANVIDEGRLATKTTAGPPPLTARGIVGGALSVIHTHLIDHPDRPLIQLTPQLMAMIVHPYLGAKAAQRELKLPHSPTRPSRQNTPQDAFKDLPIRFTYRTARVLNAIATHPGANNRIIGEAAEITDQAQTSRLLHRLHHAGLIQNHNDNPTKREPNSWTFTQRGHAIHHTLTGKH